MKQLFVELPDEIVQIIDKELVGKLGEGYSDTLRTIIANYITEHGLMPKATEKETSTRFDGLWTADDDAAEQKLFCVTRRKRKMKTVMRSMKSNHKRARRSCLVGALG